MAPSAEIWAARAALQAKQTDIAQQAFQQQTQAITRQLQQAFELMKQDKSAFGTRVNELQQDNEALKQNMVRLEGDLGNTTASVSLLTMFPIPSVFSASFSSLTCLRSTLTPRVQLSEMKSQLTGFKDEYGIDKTQLMDRLESNILENRKAHDDHRGRFQQLEAASDRHNVRLDRLQQNKENAMLATEKLNALLQCSESQAMHPLGTFQTQSQALLTQRHLETLPLMSPTRTGASHHDSPDPAIQNRTANSQATTVESEPPSGLTCLNASNVMPAISTVPEPGMNTVNETSSANSKAADGQNAAGNFGPVRSPAEVSSSPLSMPNATEALFKPSTPPEMCISDQTSLVNAVNRVEDSMVHESRHLPSPSSRPEKFPGAKQHNALEKLKLHDPSAVSIQQAQEKSAPDVEGTLPNDDQIFDVPQTPAKKIKCPDPILNTNLAAETELRRPRKKGKLPREKAAIEKELKNLQDVWKPLGPTFASDGARTRRQAQAHAVPGLVKTEKADTKSIEEPILPQELKKKRVDLDSDTKPPAPKRARKRRV